jgi:hypothetical protein
VKAPARIGTPTTATARKTAGKRRIRFIAHLRPALSVPSRIGGEALDQRGVSSGRDAIEQRTLAAL